MGEGPIGTAAARCEPMRVGNLRHMDRYSEAVRRGFEDGGGVRPGREVRVPGLPGVQSRLVVPAMALGQLVGVIVVESTQPAAFDVTDEQALGVVAATVASAVEALREPDADEPAARSAATTAPAPAPVAPTTPVVTGADVVVRYFAADGSTFLDGDYLIKGVAGRVMRSLVAQHVAAGRTEFTNRELRLDPTLELPGFKDNLESRLILLKRRLDERDAPVRIEKTGRGRFRLVTSRTLRLIEE
jgi:adenylate cyclase